MPVAIELPTAETVKVVVACPPEETVTDEEVRDTVGPVEDGDTVALRVMIPEKPFVPDRMTVAVIFEPRATFNVFGLVVMLKS